MSFGWINIFSAAIVVLILLPNLLFAWKYRSAENKCGNKLLLIAEQLGRYASMLFMIVGFREFGFCSAEEMLLYFAGNGILLMAYWAIWIAYFLKDKNWKKVLLAVLPAGIFLLSGFLLRHWVLVVSGVVFGAAHIAITVKNL